MLTWVLETRESLENGRRRSKTCRYIVGLLLEFELLCIYYKCS